MFKMKNGLNEILSLMHRMGLILEEEGRGIDYRVPGEKGEMVNGAYVFMNKAKVTPKSQDTQLDLFNKGDFDGNDGESVNAGDEQTKVNNAENSLLLPDVLDSIELIYQDPTTVKLNDLEKAFEKIKGKKIFCPQGEVGEYRDDGNRFKNPKLVRKFCEIYNDVIARNKNSRLGNTLQLLFGKEPDRSVNADFGDKKYNTEVELKTKKENAVSNIITITTRGLEDTGKLFDSDEKKVIYIDTVRKLINALINDRIERLDKGYYGKLDILVSGKKGGMAKNVSRKSFKTSKSIGRTSGSIDRDIVIRESSIAEIEIKYGINTIDIYNIWISGTLKIDGEFVSIDLKFKIESEIYPEETRIINVNVPLNNILSKIESKCPTLMVAFGIDDDNSKKNNSISESYVYGRADIFEWGGLKDSQIALYLINAGLLKVDFGLRVMDANVKNGNKIIPNCGIKFDYLKLMQLLKRNDGTSIFGNDNIQLFKYIKTI